MKNYFLLLLLCLPSYLLAQTDKYPSPEITSERLFYLQRSLNHNTVVYDAVFTPEKDLADENPIKIYWITYEKGGIIEELNYEQKKLAYGVTITKITKNHYEFTLVAYKKLKFNLELDSLKKPLVTLEINSKKMKINRIFIQSKGFLKPKVKYIEFYGTDLTSNEPVYEKLEP
jgi:hypothetical protein